MFKKVRGESPRLRLMTGNKCKSENAMKYLSIFFGPMLAVLMPIAHTHHSTTIFDQSQTVSFTGTVVEWYSGRPHAYLRVLATDESGAEKTYTLEWGGVSAMVRENNWEDSTFNVGDTVSVTGFPSRVRDGDILVESMDTDFGTFAIDEPYSSAVTAESRFAPPPAGMDLPIIKITGIATGADWQDPDNAIGHVRGAVEDGAERDYQIHLGDATFAYENFYLKEEDFTPGTPVIAEGFLAEEDTRSILFPRYMGIGDQPPSRLGQIGNIMASQYVGLEFRFGGGGRAGGLGGMGMAPGPGADE